MGRWFRFHDDALNDPKVQTLDGETFKAWVNLLCLASQNDGKLPKLDDLAFALRRSPNDVETLLERLLNATLIDRLNGGENGYHYAPHGWSERQYKSDSSSERVKRYRQRFRNVTETAPDTETETETENPPNPPCGGKPDYAFFGKVIRLLPRDLEQWCKTYHAIPDIMAELVSIDAWLVAPTTADAKRKSWFHTVAGALNRKHQEALRDRDGGSKVVIGI